MPALPSSKVDVMYAANAAKYAQHPQLQAELLATGGAEIVGGPSTSWTCAGEDHRWSDWNGAIQAGFDGGFLSLCLDILGCMENSYERNN